MKNDKIPSIFKRKKNDEVFKQLEEKKERQPFKFTKRVKGTVALLLATTFILGGVHSSVNFRNSRKYQECATESYTVFCDGEELCKVRTLEVLETTIDLVERELSGQEMYDIQTEHNYCVSPSTAMDFEIASREEVYNLIKSNTNYSILAYELHIGGEKIGNLTSQEEAESIIEGVKEHFTQGYDQDSMLEVTTVEDIEIKQVIASELDFQDKDQLIDYIITGTDEEKTYIVKKGDSYWAIADHFNMTLDDLITANPTSSPETIQIGDEINLIVPKPFVNVQVKRKVKQEEKTPYETEYAYASYMYNDEKIVTKAGEYGISEIEAIVTEENGIQIGKEVLTEKVIVEPITQLVTTGTKEPPPKKGTGYFINPLPSGRVSSRFGSRAGGFHRGLDLATRSGTGIVAADGGTVTYTGWSGTYGYVVDIDHGGGFMTRYAHCSDIYVSSGEKVYQGKTIASVGSTGLSTGPHLHFEVIKYGTPVNPSSYIGVQYRE